jgi:hypothetical protein
MERLWITRRSLLSMALLASLSSCGPKRDEQVDAAQAARTEAMRRLEGNWLLVRFQPDVALEPMLANLLTIQFGRLTVSFQNGNMTASGVGVDAHRRYQVLEAYHTRLTVRVTDEGGVTYNVIGEFRGQELWFQSRTMPWQGSGVLQRL